MLLISYKQRVGLYYGYELVTSIAQRNTLFGIPCSPCPTTYAAQWRAAGAEIKGPSDENTELKRSPFKAWSRSVYIHTCYAYCQCRSIHLHFFPKPLPIFPVLVVV